LKKKQLKEVVKSVRMSQAEYDQVCAWGQHLGMNSSQSIRYLLSYAIRNQDARAAQAKQFKK